MSEWVKWKPYRGYGRLLEAVALSTVLEILSLISWLTGLKTVICFHLLKHCWNSWLMMMFIRFSGYCFLVGIIFDVLIWICPFGKDNCFYQCVAIVGNQITFFHCIISCCLRINLWVRTQTNLPRSTWIWNKTWQNTTLSLDLATERTKRNG